MSATLLKHNPSRMTDAERVRDFVVRHTDLDLILERLRDNSGAANQHLLILGPRGMGKTTLVNRVITEIHRTPELDRRWYPIAFNEESYTVTSAAELWLQALVHLADQTRDPGLPALIEALRRERDDTRLRDRALARLLEFADSQGKRLLIALENIDMLLEQQMNDADGWDLRHTLQNEPRIMLLATSTTRLDAFHNPDKALFELFWEHALERLDLAEIQSVWHMVTGETLPPHRARPIQILTGGNTRILVILASFARGRSFRELMTDLVSLIDENTPYFKDNVESLPPEERKIFVTLADLWDPSTSRQVADRARVDIRKVSASLGRLADRGAVETVRRIDPVKFYQVSERMYNLYHLLRGRSSERVRAFVDFIVRFYDRSELSTLLPSIAGEACATDDSQPDIISVYFGILRRIHSHDDRRAILDRTPRSFHSLPNVAREMAQLQAESDPPGPPRDEATLRAAVAANPEDASAWIALGHLRRALGDDVESLACYREAWKFASHNRGLFLELAFADIEDLCEQEIQARCNTLAAESRGECIPLAQAVRAWTSALLKKTDVARRECAEILERWPQDPFAAMYVGLAYEEMGDVTSAMETHRHAIEISPQSLDSQRSLARLLLEQHRPREAVDVLRGGVETCPDDADLQLLLFRALKYELAEPEAAAEALAMAVKASPESEPMVRALAEHLMQQKDYPRAEAVLRRFFAGNARSDVLLWGLVACLSSENKIDEAEAALRQLASDSDSACSIAARANIAGVRGDLAAAVVLLQKAHATAPDDLLIFSTLVGTTVLAGDAQALRSAAASWHQANPSKSSGLLECARSVVTFMFLEALQDASGWVELASTLDPDNYECRFLSIILSAQLGAWDKAMVALATLLEVPESVSNNIDGVSDLLITMAASGKFAEARHALLASPSKHLFEPMITAFARLEGLETNPPKEVSEVVDDIILKIQSVRQSIRAMDQAMSQPQLEIALSKPAHLDPPPGSSRRRRRKSQT